MAIDLFEKGKGEVVTAPVIRSEIGGGRVQISGRMTTESQRHRPVAARRLAGRADGNHRGIRTIGPSLGADNIARHSLRGLGHCGHRRLHVRSTTACSAFLDRLRWGERAAAAGHLSMLQATLTLPGIAAMALALGMAIDSNVLINERIREECATASPAGGHPRGLRAHAWATILDSNVTTLIAGLALLAFGSGPVRGFAVVHCIGILTSMFSAVFFSRGS